MMQLSCFLNMLQIVATRKCRCSMGEMVGLWCSYQSGMKGIVDLFFYNIVNNMANKYKHKVYAILVEPDLLVEHDVSGEMLNTREDQGNDGEDKHFNSCPLPNLFVQVDDDQSLFSWMSPHYYQLCYDIITLVGTLEAST